MLYIKEEEFYSIAKVLQNHNIVTEFFKGYNGYTISDDDPKYENTLLKKGELGHINSFIQIITDAQKHNYKKILILEPDVYFCENFNVKLLESIDLFTSYKLLYLGATQNYYYGESTWTKIGNPIKSYNAYNTLGTFAVAIVNSIYQEILDLLNTFDKPTDVLFTNIQNKYKAECIVIYPNLICCNVIKSSTKNVSYFKNQVEFMKDVRWNIYKYDFINYYEITVSPGIYELIFKINSLLLDYELNFFTEFPKITNINNIINTLKFSATSKKSYINSNKFQIYIYIENSLQYITKNIFVQVTFKKVDNTQLDFNFIKKYDNEITKYYKNLFRLI